MAQYIDKDAVVAEIEKLKGQLLRGACSSQISMETSCKEEAYNEVLSFINTLEVKEVDLELVTNWFDHIAQIANDRKTLNDEVMEDWAALDEIKCLARNSSEFIKKHYRVQNNKAYENNN